MKKSKEQEMSSQLLQICEIHSFDPMLKCMGGLSHPSSRIWLRDYGAVIPTPPPPNTPYSNHRCVGGTDVFRFRVGRLNFDEMI